MCDNFIHILLAGGGDWAEENSNQLTCLPALLPAGRRPPGSMLGAIQEGVRQSSHLAGLHTRGQCPEKKLYESTLLDFMNDLTDPFRLRQWKTTLNHTEAVDLFLLYLMWVFASLMVSHSRYGQVVTQKPSAPVEFMSRFQRTVHSLSSMERCLKVWTWWPTLLKWLTFGWLAWGMTQQ